MNLVVNRTDVDVVAVSAPTYGRDRAPNLQSCNWLLFSFISPLPDLHSAIVRASRDKLNPRAACHGSIEAVDDFAVCTYSSELFAGSYIGYGESMVC
jgi:hypothetical protein